MRTRHTTLLMAIALLAGNSSTQAADDTMNLKSLGINGFEFRIDGETLLIDPYVSRDHRRVSIPSVVRKHIKQADYIILTHSHWDHLADVPEIAKYTDAVICGSETTLNICRYFKIAESRLRRYENHKKIRLGKFTLTPIRSKHKEPVGYPGRYDKIPTKLDGVADYVEGGTWALLLTGGGHTFLNVGSANLIDKELQGAKCDYLLASISGRDSDYLPRLLQCVDAKVFVPTHWDNFFGHPVEKPGERVSLGDFQKEMKRVAPSQKVRIVRPLESATLRVPSEQKAGPMSDPYAGATAVSKDGVIVLYLRGDEIVKDGAVVGSFDGAQVRRDGSIVGEIREDVYRHEGSEVWKLDKGNLYPGTEVRLEGSIIGDIRADGTIWRDGSSWGAAKPYDAGAEETMRIMVALYYFSDYFGLE